MKKQRQFSSIFLVLFSMLIGSCGASHEPTTPQPGSDDNYYREENFIQSSKVVDATQLEIYEGPKYLTSMEGYHISVNDNPLFVYKTRVNHERIFSWNVPSTYAPVVMFDFEGQVHMSVSIDNMEIQSASLSPKVYGIATEVKDNTVTFDLNYSGNYVLTLNNDSTQVIHIFANPLEENPISKEDADKDDSITYIGPGVYKADAIPTKSNSTIYLAGGAYVYGQIRMEGLENVTIRGRGIISGEIYQRRSASEYTIPVEIRSSNNIHMEGITFLDPAGWTIALYKSKDVELNNIKIVSARQNSDGISVQSCENVMVKGGFVRSWDDSLVVKNVDRGSTKNVHFDGVVVWTDLAQSMEVGYETYGPTMDEITFENITVLHNFHKAAISLHNSDDANITNVTYKNITIEDGSMLGDNQNDGLNDFLIDFTITYNIEWTKSEGVRGTVDGITIDNIKIYSLKDSIVSRIQGESEESKIKNVQISNIEIAKNTVKDKKTLNILENSYVENVSYKNKETVLGAKIKLPYQLNLDSSKKDSVTIHPSVEQDGMLVPSFAYSQGELPYIGVPDKGEYEVTATHSKGNKTTTPVDDGSGDYTLDGYSKDAVVDENTSTTWRSKAWKDEENEFVALTIDFKKKTTVGVIRVLGARNNQFFYTYSIQVWGKKIKADGTVNDKYTRLSATKDYEMSPVNGNCIDINITMQEYQGLQLRMYRNDLASAPHYYEISEIQFYPPSLSYGKAIVDSTEHNDVYNVEKLVDGDPTGTSYYESKSLPATIVIDLGDVYSVNTIVLSLPPALTWDARNEEIEIFGSDSNVSYSKDTTFTSLVAKKTYLFDPKTGNRNIIEITATQVRYIKLVITSNDARGGYNAQLSEVSVYGETI